MQTSDLGIELIKINEGFRSLSYKDSAGYPTIGYGHLIKRSDLFDVVVKGGKSYYKIDEEQAKTLLSQDIIYAEKTVKRYVDLTITNQHQFDAFVSFVYNLGYRAFVNKDGSTTKILHYHNLGYTESASKEFLRWVYAGGKRLEGLLNRRYRERDMYNGTWNKS